MFTECETTPLLVVYYWYVYLRIISHGQHLAIRGVLRREHLQSSWIKSFLNIAIASVVAISSIVVLEGSQLTDNPSHCSAMLHKRSSTNKS
jgi:hypothetical protein